jgi:hypothetical protein
MAGIRKREIVGLALVVAILGAVAFPALARGADRGQTSVATDTVAGRVQGGSTDSSPSSGGAEAVHDVTEAVTDTTGATAQPNVDATPAAESGLPVPTDETTGAVPQPSPAPVAPAPQTVTSLPSTVPRIVDTVQKDTSTIAGAVAGGGGPPAPAVPSKPTAHVAGALAETTKTLTDTAAKLTQEPVGTARALVDAVEEDASAVVGIVGGGATPSPPGVLGGGLPDLDGVMTHVTQALDPVIAILADPARLVSVTVQPPLVSGVASSRGSSIVPISESPLRRQLRFAGSPLGPGEPPPDAYAGDAEPVAANGPSHAAPGPLPSEHVNARGFVADPRRSIRSLPLLGAGFGSSSSVDPAGAPFPKLPRTPPQPEPPVLGGMSFSISLSFGSLAALAVMLASIAARSGLVRRGALVRARPAGFALPLERPG